MKTTLVLISLLTFSGCFTFEPASGTVRCSSNPARPCPSGYACLGGACWKNGDGPGRDMGLDLSISSDSGIDLASLPPDLSSQRPSDMRVADLAGPTPPDLSAPPDLANPNFTVQTPTGIPTGFSIFALYSVSPTSIWALAKATNQVDMVLHGNGSGAWTVSNPAKTDQFNQGLFDIWAGADNDVWAVGQDGILHFNGTTWTNTRPSQNIEMPRAISAHDGSYLVVVGDYIDPLISLNEGQTWVGDPIPSGSNTSLTAVWVATSGTTGNGIKSGNYFVGVLDGTILHENAGSGLKQEANTGARIYSLWGSGPNDVYACSTGQVIHTSGTGTWQSASVGLPSQIMERIWGSGTSGNVLVASDVGLYRSMNYGGSWSLATGIVGGDTQKLIWMNGTGVNDIYLITSTATILHGHF